jgi:hypothetical protein
VPNLHWLNEGGGVPLTEMTCLLGHDGWGDARFGDSWGWRVFLNDWNFIGECIGPDLEERIARLRALGDEAAAHSRVVLPEPLSRSHELVVLTHIPPFREDCWDAGRIADSEWLPYFTCKAVGEVLADAMESHPE